MKKWFPPILLLLTLTGCTVSTKLPEDAVVFQRGSSDDYVYLSAGEKQYVPYCPFKRRYMGECIGYYDLAGDASTEAGRTYVYEFKGYSSNEWIVEYDPEINEGMVMREIHTSNIPDGLTSEYEWNK